MNRSLKIVLSILIIQINLTFGQNHSDFTNRYYQSGKYKLMNDFHLDFYKTNVKSKNISKLPYVIPLQAICGTLIGGGLGGFILLFANEGANHKDVVTPAILASFAYTAGVAFGTYKIGNLFSFNGSFLPTFIGSAIGFLSCYVFIHGTTETNMPYILITTPLGAIIGYYTFTNSKMNALINISKGEISLNIPQSYITNSSKLNYGIKENVRLLSISF